VKALWWGRKSRGCCVVFPIPLSGHPPEKKSDKSLLWEHKGRLQVEGIWDGGKIQVKKGWCETWQLRTQLQKTSPKIEFRPPSTLLSPPKLEKEHQAVNRHIP
jgi:hypothetical protein